MCINSQVSVYEEWMGYGSVFIGVDNINIEVIFYNDDGTAIVEYTYERRTLQVQVPSDCIYIFASELRYEDFVDIPVPGPSNGQVEWDGELVEEDDLPF